MGDIMEVWTVIFKQAGYEGNKQMFKSEHEAKEFYKYLKSLGSEYNFEFVEILSSHMATGLYIKRKLSCSSTIYPPKD